MRKVDDKEPVSLYVYKTMTDPFAGRITFFKVFSGVIKNDGYSDKLCAAHCGKVRPPLHHAGPHRGAVTELHAGDLGAVAKLRETLTGDTLGDKGHEIFFEPVALPEPAMTYAIEPKSRADEDKLAPAVHKLMEEDLMLRFFRDPQTNEFLIAGAGQPHIEVSRQQVAPPLPHRGHAQSAQACHIAKRIRGRADAQGRHKKQTGGHGQFGDCKIQHGAARAGRGL